MARPLLTVVRRGPAFWRRSLQVRIVLSAIVMGTIVILATGWFLLAQIRDGLVDKKVDSSLAEAARETREAEARLAALPGTDYDTAEQVALVFEPLVELGELRGFGVVVTGPVGDSAGVRPGIRSSPGIDTGSVPAKLTDHFARHDSTTWAFTRVRIGPTTPGAEGVDVPGVAVGHVVRLPSDRGRYVIEYLFPMEDEAATVELVRRALFFVGSLLLLLLGVLTWLVTHQVLSPIRMARRGAERLAAGQLEERLPVRGEDDLARLAQSFNQMAAVVQRQIRQLEEMSRVQRRFTSDVSHELRTPLTTVRMATDLLHDTRDDFDPVTARAVELLETEVNRFERMLGDLLEISRFDAGAAALEPEDLDLGDLARRVVESTHLLAEQRGTTVSVEIADWPVRAEVDHRRVERILRNLVTNAIDHAESGTGVVVRVAGDEHAAAVTVRDFGVGLAPGESAMVFNRFWRADPARTRTSGGTGLGLAIALEDTHLHGGWLQAWGHPGRGALFRLTVPRWSGGLLRQSPLPLVPRGEEDGA